MGFYTLMDGLRYRREAFGCAVLEPISRKTHFFNTSASRVIEACAEPRQVDAIAAAVNYSPNSSPFSLREFLRDLVDKKLLKEQHSSVPGTAHLFFTDVTAFPVEHLYSPLGVEIEVTLKCYRKCTYCCYDSHAGIDTTKELGQEAWQAVLDALSEGGVFYLRFTGGDPLARPDFLHILRYVDSLGPVLTVGSDLTILTEAHARAFADCKNLLMVQTTLDGATAASADALRGPGSFRRVTQGLALLKDYSVPVIVGTVLHRGNVGEIRRIAELLADYDVSGYCIAPLYKAGRGRHLDNLILTNEELAEANREFRSVIAEGLIAPADPSWSSVTEQLTPTEIDHAWDNQPYLIRQPDRLLRIDSRGRCYTSIQLKELINEDVYVGNLLTTSLTDIWHEAPLLRHLRRLPSPTTPFGKMLDIRDLQEKLDYSNGRKTTSLSERNVEG